MLPQVPQNQNNANDPAGQETQRRQQIMRFGLIICLLFLMFDNGGQSSKQPPSTSTKQDETNAEIPLNGVYGNRINSILRQQAVHNLGLNVNDVLMTPPPMNVTGLFRGVWSRPASSINKNKKPTGKASAVAFNSSTSAVSDESAPK